MAAVLALIAGLITAFFLAQPAGAATVHQIEGEWLAGTPSPVRDGDVIAARWRVNINDDAAAPGNEPVDEVTFTVTLGGGVFDALPTACLTGAVTPSSSISPDGTTLVCNLGTHVQGTAVTVTTPVVVQGATGEEVTASAEIAGETADLDSIAILNPFGMDIRWQDPVVGTSPSGSARDATFQWTLYHDEFGEAGPNSVSYDITVTNTVGSGVAVGPGACEQFAAGLANGHPYSGGAHPPEQMAPFVGTCTFTRLSGAGTGTATFRMTLTGVDYSYAQRPTLDSAGSPLPPSQVAVASGQITIRITTPGNAGAITIASNAPTYTAGSGDTSVDDASNNSTTKTWTTGTINHGWQPGFTGSPASQWSDTYRAAIGSTVRQTVSYTYSNASTVYQHGGLCLLLDARYVEFEDAYTHRVSNDEPIPGATMQYYTGASSLLDPSHANYNPNGSAVCEEAAGWTTTLPADLSTVRAVKVTYPLNAALRADRLGLRVETRILETTPVGQDIWTWGAWANTAGTSLTSSDWFTTAWGRSANPADAPPLGTLTPDARYPFAANGRDVLRAVGATPQVDKDVAPRIIDPGEAATYTLTYTAESAGGVVASVNGFKLVDRLPAGLTYVPGSATPEPTVDVVDGRQILTWILNDVETNIDHTLSYQAVADASLTPGMVLTNVVSASLAGVTSRDRSVDLRIATDGYTLIAKTADQSFIPNVNGDGVGAGSWTVTVLSQDPVAQSFTDTIDILPYVGDGRGTDSTGSYDLSAPVIVAPGATAYYTTTDPATLSDDPADASNGAAGDPSGNTVGWTTTFTADATAVRVIGGALAPGGTHQFTIPIITDGVAGGDTFVNRAQARAENTRLVMRASAPTTVANFYSASLKKYVQDSDGVWRDANDPIDYPAFRIGDTVNYRVVVENTGEGTLTDIVVSDDRYPTLGAFAVAELESGNSETHEYSAVLTADDGGTLVNTASVTADTPPDADEPPSIPDDPAGIDVVNYTVIKSSDPAAGSAVGPGDTVTYTVTVTPEGNVPAEAWLRDSLLEVLDDATYNDDVNATVGGASVIGDLLEWSGTLQPGEPAVITYSVTVNDADERGDDALANTVLSPGCVGECATEHPVHDPGLELVKSVSEVVDVNDNGLTDVGDVIWYEFEVTNTGNVALADVAVDDPLLAGSGIAVTCDPMTLAPGEAVACVAAAGHAVTQADVDAGSVLNTATSVGTPPDGPPVESPPGEAATPTDPEPDIELVKSVDVDELVAGETATYTFVATNTGNVTLTDVVITDTDFSGAGDLSDLDCAPAQPAVLGPGEALECVATYVVTQADVDAGVVTNAAEVAGTPPAGPPVADEDDEIVPSDPESGMDLVKRVESVVDVNGSGIIDVGDEINYVFDVTNTGNVTLVGVGVDDAMLQAVGVTVICDPTTLAPAQMIVCVADAPYVITRADVSAGEVINTATATGAPPGGPPVDTPPTTVTTPVGPPEPAEPAGPAGSAGPAGPADPGPPATPPETGSPSWPWLPNAGGPAALLLVLAIGLLGTGLVLVRMSRGHGPRTRA